MKQDRRLGTARGDESGVCQAERLMLRALVEEFAIGRGDIVFEIDLRIAPTAFHMTDRAVGVEIRANPQIQIGLGVIEE